MTTQTIEMESLKSLYYKSLILFENYDVMEHFRNPIASSARDSLYTELLQSIYTKYNLRDKNIIDQLARYNSEYLIKKTALDDKYLMHDIYMFYDEGLANIMELLSELDMDDYQLDFTYFELLNKYREDSKEFLEGVYQYFIEHPEDMTNMFELFKLLKRKDMPDSDFKEVFGIENYTKMKNFMDQAIMNITMTNEDIQHKRLMTSENVEDISDIKKPKLEQ